MGANGPNRSGRDQPRDPSTTADGRFQELFIRRGPSALASAPGRVNLVGEHTDYSDGFVLPMAIGRRVAVAFRVRSDPLVRAHATLADETRSFDVSAARPPGDGLPASSGGWLHRVAGVWWVSWADGVESPGMDLVVAGDVPVGAGLSSSAALEVAVARALYHASDETWDAAAAAKIARAAETEFAGVSCGLMDPFASAAARKGHALLLDCRSLEVRHVRIPEDWAVLVLDTGVRRELAGEAYNQRRASCERAVELLAPELPGIEALRDVSPSELEAHRSLLDPTTYRRARHVIEENRRPRALARCLENADLQGAGEIMDASHTSLRDLYEVSSPELDAFVDAARQDPRCFGARMTGAGFGGCAVALVERGQADGVAEGALERYRAATGRADGAAFPVRADAGARLETVPSREIRQRRNDGDDTS